ncbi:hypothetical protein C8R44DRAFT_783042 [Mycena epipterygia]|nr:hypothetical protein C8R44DRAFT_783042 [Mycena epipterygia]
MSLSSLLLASGPKKIDKELDSLFKSNPAPPRKPATPIQTPIPGSAPPAKKRKIEAAIPDSPQGQKKRVKPTTPVSPPKVSLKAAKSTPAKKSKRKEVVQPESDGDSGSEEEDEDNSDLENAYLGKKKGPVIKPTAPSADSDDGEAPIDSEGNESGDADSDSDPDAPPPAHESLNKRLRVKPAKKAKIVPEGETSVQRDARTLFVGGLPVDVAQKKALQKQLSRHILSFLPSSSKVKIESTRFRSVAFRDPTSSTALSSPATPGAANANVNANSVPVPAGPNHSKVRASTWRQTAAAAQASEAEAEGDAKKAYLTPAQKKKILFIQGAFHPEASGINAYVVLAHNGDETDSPYSAAQHLANAANASEFMERTLRVDVCARLPDAAGEEAGTGPTGDPKLSIFVGNLDFGCRENDVREFFEGVVAAERGPAPAADEGPSGRWVLGVRLIRDRETQLGKGFGYVRFVDRECVDEILALAKTEEAKTKLRFAKRTVRVQRCRAGGAAAKPTAAQSMSKSTYPGMPAKRGDPTLGARLAHLDKDARKAAKKADADRVDRRAEKKKLGTRMRMGPANDKIKAVSGGGAKRVGGAWKGQSNDKGKGKDRERERKTRVNKNIGGAKGRK